MMLQDDKLRIAIIGGGIGGLCLATALKHIGDKEKYDVHIYEASPALTEIGAGINFWPRSWRIMKEIGIQSKLAELLPAVPNDQEIQTVFHVRKADQSEGVSIDDIKAKGGAIRFHRAELLGALYGQAMGRVNLSHRFITYEEVENEVVLHFDNGASATCDLLIGVDGIHSVVRKCLLDKLGLFNSPSYEPYWSGQYAYRDLIPLDELERVCPGHIACKQPMMYIGKFRTIITYPVSHKKLLNTVAVTFDPSKENNIIEGPATASVPLEEVLAAFAGCERQVQALVKCMKNPVRFALRSIRPLESFSKGRVVLLGDAAHAMMPYQGAGAGLAVEDSYVLAHLLASPLCTNSTVPNVTKVYDEIRRPAANRVIELSRLAGHLFTINWPGFEDITEGATVEVERLQPLVKTISKNWEWCWTEFADDGKRQALEMLADQVVSRNRQCIRALL